MDATYAHKRILITGGTGSFGQTVATKLLESGADEVRVLSRDEAKQDAMRHRFNDPALRFYLGDVRDYLSVDRAMRNVDYVFHAAALKQVPSGEFFPMEVVKTNVLGSDNVIRASEANGVSSLVCLSTDKAVYPVNAMGMSKAMMEKLAQSHGLNNPQANTTVSCVRYGNVMFSRGSVIPLFVQQIKQGKPLTLTNPAMTRFMMSLRHSVDLVEYAFENARQGDLFIRKAAACTMGDLATAVTELFEHPVPPTVIGIRHAEKLSETLASAEELSRAVDFGEYYRISPDARDLNYSLYFEVGNTAQAAFEDYDSHTTERLDVDQVKDLLLTIPEFKLELDEWAART